MYVLKLRNEIKFLLAAVIYGAVIGIIYVGFTTLDEELNSKEVTAEKIILEYSSNSLIDYEVILKPNAFLKDSFLPKNQGYITNLVDTIDIDFNYLLKSSISLNLDGNYKIIATVYGDKDSKTSGESIHIWNKEFQLVEPKMISGTGELKVHEKLSIPLSIYSDEVYSFVTELNIPIDAYLKVELEVDFSGSGEDQDIEDSFSTYINIPLGVATFEILDTLQKEEKEQILNSDVTILEANTKDIVINILLMFVSIMGAAVFTKKVLFNKYITQYEKEVSKILKEYDYRIVNVTDDVKIGENTLIIVTEFNELLDLANELNYPILCHKNNELHETNFFIIKNKEIYKFTISLFIG